MYKVLIFVFLISCGNSQQPDDWVTQPIPPSYEEPEIEFEEPVAELRELLDEFLYDCGEVHGADITDLDKLEYIRFGDTSDEESPNRVGLCTHWTLDDKLTRSNIVVKKLKSKIIFKALVYHELAHCVLGLDHVDQKPYAIMSPILLNDEKMYEDNWDSLVKEMCTFDEKRKHH